MQRPLTALTHRGMIVLEATSTEALDSIISLFNSKTKCAIDLTKTNFILTRDAEIAAKLTYELNSCLSDNRVTDIVKLLYTRVSKLDSTLSFKFYKNYGKTGVYRIDSSGIHFQTLRKIDHEVHSYTCNNITHSFN